LGTELQKRRLDHAFHCECAAIGRIMRAVCRPSDSEPEIHAQPVALPWTMFQDPQDSIAAPVIAKILQFAQFFTKTMADGIGYLPGL